MVVGIIGLRGRRLYSESYRLIQKRGLNIIYYRPILATAILSLCEAVLAIDGAVSAGFKRDLALLLTVCASRFEHLPWPPAESTTLLKCHVSSFWFLVKTLKVTA